MTYKEAIEEYGEYKGSTQKSYFDYLRISPFNADYKDGFKHGVFLQVHICRQILDKYKRINFKI